MQTRKIGDTDGTKGVLRVTAPEPAGSVAALATLAAIGLRRALRRGTV